MYSEDENVSSGGEKEKIETLRDGVQVSLPFAIHCNCNENGKCILRVRYSISSFALLFFSFSVA